MTRSEDPPGKVKHVRFGKVSDVIRAALESFPGIKAIVLHKNGKTGEHPHYHIWWETDIPVTNQTFRNRLKAHNDVFKSFSGQQDWSFRNHDSWAAWSNYVTSNISHEVILDHLDLKELSASKSVVSLVVTELPSGARTTAHETVKYTIQKPRTHEAMKDKFVKYLRSELNWKSESITVINYSDKIDELSDLLTDYWHNAFTTNNGAVAIEHAMYEFSDDGAREIIKMRNRLAHRKILRC